MTYSISIAFLSLLCVLAAGSLLNMSSHPHWFVRGWDFPRVQIVLIGWAVVASYFAVRHFAGSASVVPIWPMLTAAAFLTVWHGFRIAPYTPVMPTQSESTSTNVVASHRDDPSTLRVVITNVEMENDQYENWIRTIREADPDVLLVVEVDETWIDAVAGLIESYPHRVIQPHDNWYGMMMLSRLPIVDHELRYLVQDDVPSIDAKIRMDDGTLIRCVGVHPRPPEPIRGNDATARDAELTLWGTELADESLPVIIGGDLNDVAWSITTRLFLRTSGLLDPRRGRGFFNTFHADHWYMRFPLDHVFHSEHFTVTEMRRLDDVGSDHYPILIDLRRSPSEQHKHDVLENKEADAEEVEVRIERAVEDDDLQGEAVDEGRREQVKDVESSPN